MSELSFSEISKNMDKHSNNEKYFIDNYNIIRKNHIGKFVAVDNGKCLSSPRIDSLLSQIDSEKLNRQTVFIQFIPEKIYDYVI